MTDAAGVDLPYFDVLLAKLDGGGEALHDALGLHVHWGYWEDPRDPDLSSEGIRRAVDALTQRLFDEASLRDGQRILDVGCGFGGAISMLDARHSDADLVGLNIDGRQLEVARDRVRPRGSNSIRFIEGDACELPFEDRSFDTVLAVECIFHFRSRETFLREAQRVLKPGGRLVFSDFVVHGPTIPLLLPLAVIHARGMKTVYGLRPDAARMRRDYGLLARKLGFPIVATRDITRNTMPTYQVLALWHDRQRQSLDPIWARRFLRVNRFLRLCALMRFVRYTVICHQRPGGAS